MARAVPEALRHVLLQVAEAFRMACLAVEGSAFVDGGASPNPGIGGWGVILEVDGIERESYGGRERATNNQMELEAVYAAVKGTEFFEHLFKKVDTLTVYTDSQVVYGWVTGAYKCKTPALLATLGMIRAEIAARNIHLTLVCVTTPANFGLHAEKMARAHRLSRKWRNFYGL